MTQNVNKSCSLRMYHFSLEVVLEENPVVRVVAKEKMGVALYYEYSSFFLIRKMIF